MATFTIWYSYQDSSRFSQIDVSESDDRNVLQTVALIWDALESAGFHMRNVRPIPRRNNQPSATSTKESNQS